MAAKAANRIKFKIQKYKKGRVVKSFIHLEKYIETIQIKIKNAKKINYESSKLRPKGGPLFICQALSKGIFRAFIQTFIFG